MPRSSPFASRSAASNGVTFAVPPSNGMGSVIMGGVKDLMGVMDSAGQGGERRAHANYYNSEAEKNAAATARQATKDSAIQQAVQDMHREAQETGNQAQAYLHFQERVAPYYADDHGAAGMRAVQMDGAAVGAADPSASPFARNIATTLAGVNGNFIKDDEALTAADHDRQFKAKDDSVRYGDDQRRAASEYGSRQQAGATVGAARIGADASIKVGQGHDATSLTVGESKNRTDRFNNAFTATMQYQKPNSAVTGSTTESTTTENEDGTKHTITQRVPNPRRPAAAAAPAAGGKPPVAGAKQAADGNWYLPDPNRPGKYLKVG